MSAEELPSWNTVFRRSRSALYTFSSRDSRIDEVIPPLVKSTGVFDNMIECRPLIDGLVICTSHYGFGGYLSDGYHVVGYRALRWLCDQLGLKPPRRLEFEEVIDPIEDLRAAYEWQRTWTPEQLEAQNAYGHHVILARDLIDAVDALEYNLHSFSCTLEWWRANALKALGF